MGYAVGHQQPQSPPGGTPWHHTKPCGATSCKHPLKTSMACTLDYKYGFDGLSTLVIDPLDDPSQLQSTVATWVCGFVVSVERSIFCSSRVL